jgi:hypothetical protein
VPSIGLPSIAVPSAIPSPPPSGSLADAIQHLIDVDVDGGDLLSLDLGILGLPSTLASGVPLVAVPAVLPSAVADGDILNVAASILGVKLGLDFDLGSVIPLPSVALPAAAPSGYLRFRSPLASCPTTSPCRLSWATPSPVLSVAIGSPSQGVASLLAEPRLQA